MSNEVEYEGNLINLTDEEGVEHEFEFIDALELEGNRYYALIPVAEEPEEAVESDAELVILKEMSEGDEEFLEPIEDEDEFNKVADIFMDRLSDLYEIEE